QSVGCLRARVGELSTTCRDKDSKMKKLLVETEKLSAEVLGLRGQSAQLQLQLEVGASTQRHPLPPPHPLPPSSSSSSSPAQVQQKNHRDIITVYRTHLLHAAQ
ncbi:ANR35 protein, partial [Galbula dea]|nr:ANR35 protein [Galbula dea]